MGGEGQGEARRRTDHLRLRRDRRTHLPAPVLCEERHDEKKELRQIAAHLKGLQ